MQEADLRYTLEMLQFLDVLCCLASNLFFWGMAFEGIVCSNLYLKGSTSVGLGFTFPFSLFFSGFLCLQELRDE